MNKPWSFIRTSERCPWTNGQPFVWRARHSNASQPDIRGLPRQLGSATMREAVRCRRIGRVFFAAAIVLFAISAPFAAPLAAREREPNSVYADRRAHLVAQLNTPVLLFGYTGGENSSPAYVF